VNASSSRFCLLVGERFVSARPDFALVVFFAAADALVADFFAADFFCGFFFATALLAASFLGTFFFAGLAFFAAVFFVLFLRRFSAAIIEKFTTFLKSQVA
jgi:hypothetical protein